ncbi:MAG: glycerate kinase [Cryobacterium sp.]|uniref:glycerate kinase n=1 Tax=unclassified Cryobacterium TaxID=2649013 RepID=UPI0018CB8173|nr:MULTISPECIES: glycerate kinase [unclassified Cryobacterium]MCY7405366.1 glycerate kinase [Cryobacterium sp.]MEC5152870.1 glycerate kinase [Cryobacterium sp. CAN_C3]
MRVVIAPDKFKGSLSAPEVAQHLAVGLRTSAASLGYPIDVLSIPVADGGEGTVDAAVGAGFQRRTATVTGPTGRLIQAAFAVRGSEAVIEMAAASGLGVLPDGIPAPLSATSRGTGELIRAALDAGCRHIVLAIGGSASTDGGSGVLRGLGARFLDSRFLHADGAEIPGGGGFLAGLDRIDLSGLDDRLRETSIVLATDVDNPLLGARGAAAVFGPQKGASPADILDLEAGLAHFVTVLGEIFGAQAKDAANAAGAGAAGGVGYAALTVLGATRRPGIDIVLEFTELNRRLAGADLVITGEGSLDHQSLAGKTPVGVARAATRAGIPVIAVCGRTTLEPREVHLAGFQRIYPLTALEPDLAVSMTQAGRLLEQLGRQIGRHFAPNGPPAQNSVPALVGE